MVKKLLKHELIALLRVVYVPAIVMVALAILLRISAAGASENNVLFITMLAVFYVYAIFATEFVCFAMGVSRFYKSFFTGEGYMTLSLPATASQLIWSKLLSALIVMLLGTVACVLSGCIFLIGLPSEFYASMVDALGSIGDAISWAIGQEPMLFVELLILGIVTIPSGFLVFYLVISLAQLFTTKNRKGMIFLIYFVGMFVCGIVSSVLLRPMLTLMLEVSYHLAMWLSILFYVAVDVGSFFIVRYILMNKVNMTA